MSRNITAKQPRIFRANSVALSLIAALWLGMGVYSPRLQAEPVTTSVYSMPITTFITNLLNGMLANHYKFDGHVQFHMPAIWLFSPDGKMVAQAMDSSSLAALMSQLPPDTNTPVVSNVPDLAVFDQVLAQSAGVAEDSVKAAGKGQWTAVLFSSDSPACKKCTAFEKSFRTMQKNSSVKWHPIAIMLTQ